LMKAHLEDSPTPPRSLVSELPEGADAVLLRALAKSRADRYQSAAEFREVLNQTSLTPLSLAPATGSLTQSPQATAEPKTNSEVLTEASAATHHAEKPFTTSSGTSNTVGIPKPSAVTLRWGVLIAAGAIVVGGGIALIISAERNESRARASVAASIDSSGAGGVASIGENTADEASRADATDPSEERQSKATQDQSPQNQQAASALPPHSAPVIPPSRPQGPQRVRHSPSSWKQDRNPGF